MSYKFQNPALNKVGIRDSSAREFKFRLFGFRASATSFPAFILSLILMLALGFVGVSFLTLIVMWALAWTPLAPGFWACFPIALIVAILAPNNDNK